jgi:nanoRNase/pAp phosphatase (c-di-AMP/oligoRNAs hydrolase)
MEGQKTSRSNRLLNLASKYRQVVVIMHDNPDPDAIASGWAILWLLRQKLGIEARLLGGGGIVRAENRQMVTLLNPPIELVQQFEASPGTAAILVDCGPAAGNHLLATALVRPIGVIDHHDITQPQQRLPFEDIRPNVAASATIASSYLREQKLRPHEKLATALLYAIRTETRGAETHYTRLDRRVVSWLSKLADPADLAEIENAPLSRAYFADLVLALQCTDVYDETALCFLPRAQGAEIIGEVADLLVRCDQIRHVLCAAVIGEDLLLSVRTDKNAGNAADLVQALLHGFGQGGGHQHRAGGKITGAGKSALDIERLHDKLRTRWLAVCGFDALHCRRLVPKRDIVDNL